MIPPLSDWSDCIVFESDYIVFESDGLFSFSVVLSSSFVRIKRFYCSIVSHLEKFFHQNEFLVNESRVRGRERSLLSIPRQVFKCTGLFLFYCKNCEMFFVI